MKNKAFTLIELLVVTAIIGILAGIILASLNSAREKGRVANLKSTLKNLQNQAQIYHLENGTFAGLCNYITPPAAQTYHSSIQPFIDSLTSLVGSENVRCIVRTSNVPSASGSHYKAEDSLETKNFAVVVNYNDTHYAVDVRGVMVLDNSDSNGGASANWTNASNICASAGKRLPSVEILKAISDYGGSGGNPDWGIVSGAYWSSTPSSISSTNFYALRFDTSSIIFDSTGSGRYVRCGS